MLQGAQAASKLLQINTTLQELDLRANALDHVSAAPIVRALCKNRSMRKLYLDGNLLSMEVR